MDAKSQSEKFQDSAQETIEDLDEAREEIQNRLASLWETGREKATEYARTADEQIRARPYQAVGIAFGIGLIAGLLLTRRGSSED